MSITLRSIKCPECGANLNVESNRNQFFCSYCGAKVVLTNENEHIFRHIDEADFTRAETERIVQMRELALSENDRSLQKTVTIIWVILSLVLILIAILIMLFGRDDEDFPGWAAGFLFLFYVCGPIIGGGAYLVFKYLPNKEAEKRIQRQGGIRITESLANATEMNYEGARDLLINAGFRNISCVNLHDLKLGILTKPGTVNSISVDGKMVQNVGSYYMPNSEIVITYHGR